MEVLKRMLLCTATTLVIISCDYMGFDGYINQLDAIGINVDLADAVSLNQHITSRPREFEGRVYVLGTRGVFVMNSRKLKDYDYYPYSQDLGYDDDYWEDRLPPINCYRDPQSGRIILNSLYEDWDRGLRYGDTLTLYEDPKMAVFEAVDTSVGEPFSVLLNNGGFTHWVVTDLFNNWEDEVRWFDPADTTIFETSITPEGDFVLNRSFRSSPDGFSVILLTQTGTTVWGKAPATLKLHVMSPGAWGFATPVATVGISELIEHNESKWTTVEYWVSGNLEVSTNTRYMLLYGESLDDGDTMLIYDYTNGERQLKTGLPGNNMYPELGESGMTVFVSSIGGGVAKYVYD